MSKIVCDICGTSYDDTVGACPVCGWSQTGELPSDNSDFDDDFLDEIQDEEPAAEIPAPVEEAPAPATEKPGKVAFDYDAVNGRRRPAPKVVKPAPKQEDEDDDEDDEDEEEESGSNVFLVIILVLLILALLAVSAYIGWTKILKPRQMGSENNKPQETITADGFVSTEQTVGSFIEATNDNNVDTVETESTEPQVPCTDISLAGNVDTLFIGQYWRLMAKPTPENTTEKIVYTSSDENVITVDEYGRVTAVGEGNATITVTCGSQRLDTTVSVKSSETDVTEATTVPTAAPVGGTSGNTEASAPAGTTVATPTGDFKLSWHDRTIGRRGVYITIPIEGGIAPESIKWSTSDSSVATVYNGDVTCIGRGVCIITAEYNGQTDQCIIRCKY